MLVGFNIGSQEVVHAWKGGRGGGVELTGKVAESSDNCAELEKSTLRLGGRNFEYSVFLS